MPGMATHTFSPSRRGGNGGPGEFEASVICIVSARTSRAM